MFLVQVLKQKNLYGVQGWSCVKAIILHLYMKLIIKFTLLLYMIILIKEEQYSSTVILNILLSFYQYLKPV